MKKDSAKEIAPSALERLPGGGCAERSTTFVDALVETIKEEYGHRDTIDCRTGQVCERTFTGVTTRSMAATDLISGRLIENLPAALDCKPGDIVRITVEVIKSSL